MRVRTDDLESVRVERAIKRTRSDLAAHIGGVPTALKTEEKEKPEAHERPDVNEKVGKENLQTGVNTTSSSQILDSPQEVHGEEEAHAQMLAAIDLSRELEKEIEQEVPVKKVEVQHPSKAENTTDSTVIQTLIPSEPATPVDDVVAEDVSAADPRADQHDDTIAVPAPPQAAAEVEAEVAPPTPVAPPPESLPRHAVHRSQSLDPDRSYRMSRAYTTSVPSQSGAESQTGDEGESSSSALDGPSRRRKKRSESNGRVLRERKSQRKVIIDDFEMMRVLGKGCAGKVLLVRHKATTDLFALKAITKRHVLAHQELQHTLTEQAVLKRMAAEGKDPFVVKLWWSFHDKENLFLVMVS